MQIIGPRASTLGTVYSAAQIIALTQQPVLVESTAFERVTLAGSQGEFTSFVDLTGAMVEHDTTRIVPRTLTARIRQDAGLDWYNDNVRVWKRYQTPDTGWLDVLVGTFIPVGPGTEVDDAQVWRTVTMADSTQVINDTELSEPFGVNAGADLIATAATLIRAVLPGVRIYAIPSAVRNPAPLTWSDGVTLIQVINDMMDAIGYLPVFSDETSAIHLEPLANYASLTPDFTFDLTQPGTSMASLVPGAPFTENVDTTQGFNIVTMKGEDPRRNTISATYQNQSAQDPLSVLNFRAKLEVVTDSKIADVATCLARARFECQYRSRVGRPFLMETVSWPWSQNFDVFQVALNNPDTGLVVWPFLNTAWSMDLAPGGTTKHTLQRLYAI